MSSSKSTHCSCCVQREINPPSISHFRGITPENVNHIAHIDADVLNMHYLLNQRAALNRKQNSFVPAVNLPPEVLSMIFEFACCPDVDSWVDNMDFHIQHNQWYCNQYPVSACAVTPLFIGTICSAWRSIAWGSSQLWNDITLLYKDGDAEKSAKMLDYWLAKSGERPLTVKLIEDENQWLSGESTEVIDVIAAYAHRLHTVDLFLPGPWEDALIRIVSCAPMLTRLSLKTSEYAEEDNPSIELTGRDVFANALKLREVTLYGYSAGDILLPWGQLESLESGYRNVFKLIETLRLCSRLRRCGVDADDMLRGTSLPLPMTHTALEVLEVFGDDDNALPELFKMLKLPALRCFALRLLTRTRNWSPWLPSFLSHVAITLETLDLSHVAPVDEDLLAILQVVRLPKLRKLLLCNSNTDGQEKLTQKFLDVMNPNKYEGLGYEGIVVLDGQSGESVAGTLDPDERSNTLCLLPNLETFEYEGEIDFTPHALVEFLVARWGGPSSCTELDGPGMRPASELALAGQQAPVVKLRSVKFQTPTQIEFDGLNAAVVRTLQLEGMCLEFLSY